MWSYFEYRKSALYPLGSVKCKENYLSHHQTKRKIWFDNFSLDGKIIHIPKKISFHKRTYTDVSNFLKFHSIIIQNNMGIVIGTPKKVITHSSSITKTYDGNCTSRSIRWRWASITAPNKYIYTQLFSHPDVRTLL